jgi:hypothetical protein
MAKSGKPFPFPEDGTFSCGLFHFAGIGIFLLAGHSAGGKIIGALFAIFCGLWFWPCLIGWIADSLKLARFNRHLRRGRIFNVPAALESAVRQALSDVPCHYPGQGPVRSRPADARSRIGP